MSENRPSETPPIPRGLLVAYGVAALIGLGVLLLRPHARWAWVVGMMLAPTVALVFNLLRRR
jgi:hypothetical protein